MMAEWDAAYINDLPDSAFAVVLPGGTKDDSGRTVPRSLRKLPHHNASGAVDMPHLRNAMSREPQSDMPAAMHSKAESHLSAHMDAKSPAPMKATILDDDRFRLLALPFGGPIPFPGAPRGVDIDRQWFDTDTDFGRDLPAVKVTWHHGGDPRRQMGKAEIAEASEPEFDDDGGWVDFWMREGSKRVNLIKRLAERGTQLFGSSEAVIGSGRVRTLGESKAELRWSRLIPGQITRWHYNGLTLSSAPQNTLSVLRPMKATLDDLASGAIVPTDAFFSDLAAFMDNLATGPAADPTGDAAAKAGRVLADDARTRSALAELSAAFDEIDRILSG